MVADLLSSIFAAANSTSDVPCCKLGAFLAYLQVREVMAEFKLCHLESESERAALH